jgi:hypothetical protein
MSRAELVADCEQWVGIKAEKILAYLETAVWKFDWEGEGGISLDLKLGRHSFFGGPILYRKLIVVQINWQICILCGAGSSLQRDTSFLAYDQYR